MPTDSRIQPHSVALWRSPTRTLSPQREGTYIPCSKPPVAGRCGAAPGLTSGGCGSHRTHAYLMRLELPPPPILTARGSHQGLRCDVVARIIRGARTVNMVGSGIATVQSTLYSVYLSIFVYGYARGAPCMCHLLPRRRVAHPPPSVARPEGHRYRTRAHHSSHHGSKQLQTTSTNKHSARALDVTCSCAALAPPRGLRAGIHGHRSTRELGSGGVFYEIWGGFL